jgi:hypothetical protein
MSKQALLACHIDSYRPATCTAQCGWAPAGVYQRQVPRPRQSDDGVVVGGQRKKIGFKGLTQNGVRAIVRGGTDPTLVVESVYYLLHRMVLPYTRVQSGDIVLVPVPVVMRPHGIWAI